MVGGRAIEAEPGGEQDEAEQPGDEKGGAPAEGARNRDADQRGEQHPDIGAGVEDADPERALAAREPFGDRPDRARIGDRKSTRLNSSHYSATRMPSSA